MTFCSLDLLGLEWEGKVEFCEYGKELSGPVKYGRFLDSVTDYSLL